MDLLMSAPWKQRHTRPLSDTDYSVKGQRAAVSTPSNIAKGWLRYTEGVRSIASDCPRFGCEHETQLLVAKSLGYGSTRAIDRISSEVQEARMKLYSIIRRVGGVDG
jgi:four helix bundle protein